MSTIIKVERPMQRRSPCRTRHARSTIVTKPSPGRARLGFSLIELLVVVAFTSIMAGIAYSRMTQNRYSAWNAQAQVIADIRHARNDALTKGDHFRLDITSATTYTTRRLQLVGGVWTPTSIVRTGTLPSGVTFTAGVGRQIEFTTRGLMVTPDAATTLVVTDSPASSTRSITVWPSGQVSPT